jgi:hypothetical protein
MLVMQLFSSINTPRMLFAAALTAGFLSSTAAQAQEKFEGLFSPHKRRYDYQGRMYFRGPVRLSAGLGTAYYSGDLTSSLSENYLHPAVNVGAQYRLGPHFVAAGELMYMTLAARDHLTERNLAFVGRNLGLTAFLRYNPLADGTSYAGGSSRPSFVLPFVQIGVGTLLFSPSVSRYDGVSPSASDGTNDFAERVDYPSVTSVLPIGAGLTFRVNPRINTSVEANYYFTNTDSLDDVKFRGNPNQNDGFGTAMIKLEYSLAK